MSAEARTRDRLANQMYNNLASVLLGKRTGADFHGGVPYKILGNEAIFGYRSLTLRVDCGLDNERLFKKLTPAIAPQFVPWDCELRKPFVYPAGRFIAVDVPWPAELQRNDIRLNDVCSPQARHGGRIIIGPNVNGTNITLPAHDFHHLLVGGQSGSGKSVTMQTITAQLWKKPAGRPPNWIVLLDGKGGEGLRIVDRLPGQVGPLATTLDATVNALGWCAQEMQRRYEHIDSIGGRKLPKDIPHLFILFDEFQRWTKELDHPVVKALTERLMSQGRAAGIHGIFATQKPTVDVFGKKTSTRGQFDAVVGQSVVSAHESRMLVGTDYRCDTLEMRGDAFVAASVPHRVGERVQVSRFTESELEKLPRAELKQDEYPVCDVEILGKKSAGRKAKVTTDKEWAVCYQAEAEGRGAPWIIKRFPKGKGPGTNRALRIREQCGRILKMLGGQGYRLQKEGV